MYKLCKFQVNILFVTDFINLQSSKSGCVNYARFRKSGNICMCMYVRMHVCVCMNVCVCTYVSM